YYFGSKEKLVQELLIECARRSDAARCKRLAELRASGGPTTVRDIVAVIVGVEVAIADAPDEGGASWMGQMRFILGVQINHRQLMINTMSDDDQAAYLECTALLKQFLSGLPSDIVKNRIIVCYLYIISVLAAREAAIQRTSRDAVRASGPFTFENIVQTACGMLMAPLD
ncbi:MAG: hypothetical protein Q7J57_09225, partial [Gemmobacter sp.]|nr:hypothetical protein [Gemmobacter sp.]